MIMAVVMIEPHAGLWLFICPQCVLSSATIDCFFWNGHCLMPYVKQSSCCTLRHLNSSDNSVLILYILLCCQSAYQITFPIKNGMLSDGCSPSDHICPSTGDQMYFSILTCHHYVLYLLTAAGREHPPCMSLLSYPPSRVGDCFPWKWLYSTAPCFIRVLLPWLCELKSVIHFYPSIKDTRTWRQFLVFLEDSLQSFLHRKLLAAVMPFPWKPVSFATPAVCWPLSFIRSLLPGGGLYRL